MTKESDSLSRKGVANSSNQKSRSPTANVAGGSTIGWYSLLPRQRHPVLWIDLALCVEVRGWGGGRGRCQRYTTQNWQRFSNEGWPQQSSVETGQLPRYYRRTYSRQRRWKGSILSTASHLVCLDCGVRVGKSWEIRLQKTPVWDDNRTSSLIKEFTFSFKAIGIHQDILSRGLLMINFTSWTDHPGNRERLLHSFKVRNYKSLWGWGCICDILGKNCQGILYLLAKLDIDTPSQAQWQRLLVTEFPVISWARGSPK